MSAQPVKMQLRVRLCVSDLNLADALVSGTTRPVVVGNWRRQLHLRYIRKDEQKTVLESKPLRTFVRPQHSPAA
jgi:hypothetical protein